MKKCAVLLITLSIFFISLPNTTIASLMIESDGQFVRDNRGTPETSDDMIWYRNLLHFKSLTYHGQIEKINTLPKIEGFERFHMATLEEFNILSINPASSVRSSFPRTSPMGDVPWTWYGRIDHQVTESERYLAQYSDFSNHPLIYPWLDKNTSPGIGAWVVAKAISNNIPTANAGENINIGTEQQSGTVLQGTATDSDGDGLKYRWLEGSIVLQDWKDTTFNNGAPLNLNTLQPLSIGTHYFTLEISDGKSISSDEMILTINNSAPHAGPSGGGVYQISTPVVIDGQVSDFDGDLLSYEWWEGGNLLASGTIQAVYGGTPAGLPSHTINNLDLGIHTLTLKVSDRVNQPVSSNINVEIIDTIAPIISPAADKTILWPAKHQMVNVTIFTNSSDNSGDPVSLTAIVSSNEPQNGLGDGDTSPDWTEPIVSDGIITLQLRAERSGKGNGRIYTIYMVASDQSGNSSTAQVNILVPHDKGK